jgi:hypothetical protein
LQASGPSFRSSSSSSSSPTYATAAVDWYRGKDKRGKKAIGAAVTLSLSVLVVGIIVMIYRHTKKVLLERHEREKRGAYAEAMMARSSGNDSDSLGGPVTSATTATTSTTPEPVGVAAVAAAPSSSPLQQQQQQQQPFVYDDVEMRPVVEHAIALLETLERMPVVKLRHASTINQVNTCIGHLRAIGMKSTAQTIQIATGADILHLERALVAAASRAS